MSEDQASEENKFSSYEITCKNCGAPRKSLEISCTKAGMFVSYFHIICTKCSHEYDDRWADEAL